MQKCHAVLRPVENMHLSGSPTSENILRCETAIYNNEGEGIISHLYDIVRSPSYKIGIPFPFLEAYHFLGNTTIRGADDSAAKTTKDNVGDGSKNKRPIGTKEERQAGKARKLVRLTTAEQCPVGIADSLARIEKSFSETQEGKLKISERRMSLEERKLDYQFARELFGEHSDASTAEKARVRALTLKRMSRSFEVNIKTEWEGDSFNNEDGELPLKVPHEERFREGDFNDVANNSPDCHSRKPVRAVDGGDCECGSRNDVTKESLSFGKEHHTV